ncbi:hypothetical protein MNB_SUP05-5-411 [hydrothermal vent metagenome]|uniref:Lipoprotein n=1 Tax=hydrothermal vent metagenome TaxID=652676 RepID=A0A1W1CCD0_9ZZZZ
MKFILVLTIVISLYSCNFYQDIKQSIFKKEKITLHKKQPTKKIPTKKITNIEKHYEKLKVSKKVIPKKQNITKKLKDNFIFKNEYVFEKQKPKKTHTLDLWNKIVKGYKLPHHNHPSLKWHLKWFEQNPDYLTN